MRLKRVFAGLTSAVKAAILISIFLPRIAIAETEAESLEVIAHVYADNREKLQSFTCRFKVTEGIAPSAADALAEKFDPISVQDGLWIVDRGDVRYELTCVKGGTTRAELLRNPPGKTGAKTAVTSVDCAPRFELFSAKQQIRANVSALLNTANLYEKSSSDVLVTPVSMGAMGPGEIFSPFQMIRGHQAGSRYCKYLGKSNFNGRMVDMIEMSLQKVKAGEVTIVWYVDVANGAFPLKCEFVNQDGSIQHETVCTKVRRLDNGAYLSERSVFLSHWPNGWKTIIIELISMDLNAPARESFAMTLPERCKVLCMKDLRLNVRVTTPEVLHIDDLQNWVTRCETRGAKRIKELEKAGITYPRQESRGISRWIILGVSLVVFVGLSMIVRRFLRS